MADSSKKMSLMGLTTLVTVNMIGLGHHPAADEHGATRCHFHCSHGHRHRRRLHGHRRIAFPVRHLLSAPGGLSAYTEEAHAKSGFFLCSYLYFLSLGIANVAVATSAVGYMTAFVPWLGSGAIPLFIGTVGLLWLTTVANFGGRASRARSVRLPCGVSSSRWPA